MNTKKIILATVGGILVLALLITGIVLAVKNLGGKTPGTEGGSSSLPGSSDASDASGSAGQDTSSADTVSGGQVKLPSVKASAGKTVSVPITLSQNPGVNAAQLFFEYDASVLTYDGCENGDIFDECLDNDTGGTVAVIIQSSGIEDVTASGTLLTLNFTVKDSAAKGTYTIRVSDNSMFCNADEQIVVPGISEGTVTVG